MKKLTWFVCLLLISAFPLKAQINASYQTWLDYDHHIKLTGNWIFLSDYGFRWSDVLNNGYWRIHARPGIEFRPQLMHTFRGGVGFFYQENLSASNTIEIRPWQGYILRWPNIDRFRFYNYIRLEERFLGSLSDEGFAFSFKLRYKLGVSIPLNNPTISVGTFYIPISFEFFADLVLVNQEITSDRNRSELGLGYRWTKKTRVRILYTFQAAKNNQDGSKNTDHIIRLTYTQNFGFD